MNAFDEIYVLDLHGGVKKKEVSPNGDQDKNVFDIQQGVAIGIFVRRPSPRCQVKVFHADLYGPRDAKYDFLNEGSVSNTEWT